jgi:hypothetical protein
LCRRLLDVRAEAESIVFTEGDMAQHAKDRTAAKDASLEKRARRAPVSSRAGEAWRRSPPITGKR